MRYLAVALVLLSCVVARPPQVCMAECGIELLGLPDGGLPETWTCKGFQEHTSHVLATFNHHVTGADRRFGHQLACSAVRGWWVRINPAPSWPDQYGRYAGVSGLSYCMLREMEVGNKPITQSSYAHELAHAIQNCTPNLQPACPRLVDGHECWEQDGVERAIELTRGVSR